MGVESDILSGVIGCKVFHEYAPEYGERAWKAKGENVDVIYWDEGNGWCGIMDVIPKTQRNQKEVINFYRKLSKTVEKCYDDNVYRID